MPEGTLRPNIHIRPPFSRVALAGFLLALLAAFLAVFSGLGHRWGIWNFRVGLTVFRYSAYIALAAVLVSFAGIFASLKRRRGEARRRGLLPALAGLLTGLAVLWTAYSWSTQAKIVPPIHDITTDTENPPKFVAILQKRFGSPNPAEYGGPEVALQQQKAYPEIKPLDLKLPPDKAFDIALKAAKEMGWTLVEPDRTDLRIEATDETFWFGFKDDIVVRITPLADGSRIDVRSASRVGKSDVGTNAKRIRKYLEKIKKKA